MGKKQQKGKVRFSTVFALTMIILGLVVLTVLVLGIMGNSPAPSAALERILLVYAGFGYTTPYALIPLCVLCFAFGICTFLFRKDKPFSFVTFPLWVLMYMTVNFFLDMRTGEARPKVLYRSLMADGKSVRSASLLVVLVFLVEVLLLLLVVVVGRSANASYRKRKAFKEQLKALKAKDEAPDVPETKPLSRREQRKLRKAQEKEERARAKAAKKAEKKSAPVVAEKEKEVEEATVVVPDRTRQNDELTFPTFMEVPAIEHLTKKNPTVQAKPAPKAEVPIDGVVSVGALDVIKQEVEKSHPVETPQPQPQPQPEGKHMLSGFLQGALEAVGKSPKADKQKKHQAENPAHGKGLLVEAVEENERKNRDIASMGSSFSKSSLDPESAIMKPVELQEKEVRKPQPAYTQPLHPEPIFYTPTGPLAVQDQEVLPEPAPIQPVQPKSAPRPAEPARMAEPAIAQKPVGPIPAAPPRPVEPALTPEPAIAQKHVEPIPAPPPKPAEPVVIPKTVVPMAKPAVQPPEEEEDESEEDQLECGSGVGGLQSSNAGTSALLNRQNLDYHYPPTSILVDYPSNGSDIDQATVEKGDRLVQTLDEFHVKVEMKDIVKGPTVTMFEIMPAPGVRVNQIENLADNIQLRLPATQVRIVAPIPGKTVVGVEIPNAKRDTVGFKEMIPAIDLKSYKIPMVLGKNLLGQSIVIDVASTPHLLIAGATGSGKSVCVNSLICSILYRKSPKQVRLILVDPKIVELQIYNGIPHLLTPVITEPKRTLKALDFCLWEMERRYKLLQGLNARNIVGYNEKIDAGNVLREKLPYIVVVIDEFADLMHTVGKEMEAKVSRLTAMSRAVGIHLVLATQRPSVDVITGIIKTNIPSRIAFAVTSNQDSRIIIDEVGAEKLLGKGDMLYVSSSDPSANRIQGAFLSDDEVEKVVDFASQEGTEDFIDESFFEDEPEKGDAEAMDDGEMIGGDDDDDALMQQALAIVVERKSASASYLQRRLRIGYNRAARLVEEMEEQGYVGPANGSKPRPLLRYPGSVSLGQQDAGEVVSGQSDGGQS